MSETADEQHPVDSAADAGEPAAEHPVIEEDVAQHPGDDDGTRHEG